MIKLTYEEWIAHVEDVLLQYDEGAILSGEAFNAIIAKAVEVEQIQFCYICGKEKDGSCTCDAGV